MATQINPLEVQDFDQPLITDPTYSVTHVFSTDDITVSFDGDTVGSMTDPLSVFDTSGANGTKTTQSGVTLYPIDSEFGFHVTDFVGAEGKELDGDYAEGWAGNLEIAGVQSGIVISDAPTDTFKTPAVLGTWLSGLGGNSVKASTEHYSVMQNVLSDQQYPDDPDAVYQLDDNLILLSQNEAWNGQYVADLLADPEEYGVTDRNEDGVLDIRDVMNPNESTIEYDIAYGDDYSVTLKDDGKLLYRWGNTIKRPNDVRLEVEMELPDEWSTPSEDNPSLMPLYKITAAELVTHHTITNNPNDQIRPEDYENEAAIGQLPTYEIIADYNLDGNGSREVWVTTDPYYAGDGTLYEAGTILRDDFLASVGQASALAAIGGASEDVLEGFTNAWFTTMNREPFEPVLNDNGTEYADSGPRWRLKPNKYGQDLPGVEIPVDPSAPPPPTRDEIKYETGAETQTVINLLDWKLPFSPLSISAGWMNNPGTVSGNGVNMTTNFDVAFYIKGDIKPAELYSTELLMNYEEIEIFDAGETIVGTAGEDYLVGQGGNDFTGGAGNDLFVLAYGAESRSFASSTIADFTAGEDMLGLINHGVNDVTFDTKITQTVSDGNLLISLDGQKIASLTGVTEELELTDFLFSNTTLGGGGIVGTDGDDLLVGDAGKNGIYGFDGNDTLQGVDGDDTIYGGNGDDSIEGGSGNDMIDAGSGNDLVNGGAGNDTVTGNYQEDTLAGNSGDDVLAGSAGSDLLFGGDGNDFLNGGFANDRLNGGDGADRFYHAGAAGHGSDWVQDYDAAEGDVLLFGDSTADVSDFLVSFASSGSGDATVDEAFITYVPGNQVLWALVDGAAQDSINLSIGGTEYDLLA
ncbi:hypothetical protein KBY24_18045 [Ruegeria pomeroyi]|nr:hypothetical protein [Ruegeria pomeroyi]MCE8535292.1 hypothetical protein [Ruegeria pomeroyi]